MENVKLCLQIIESSPVPTFWKDASLNFIGCNNAFVKMVGASSREAFLGKRDIELPWSPNWEEYERDDTYVLQTGTPISRLEGIPSSDGGIVLSKTTKHPLMENGKIVGIVGYCKDVTLEKKLKEVEAEKQIEKINSKLIDLVEKFVNDARLCQVEIINERVGLKFPDAKPAIAAPLSKREIEILYCLSLHKTPKEISRILSLAHGKEVSVRSVQTIINEKLYSKLDVHTTGHLIERAAALNLIPLHMPK